MNKTKIEWVKNPDGTQGYTWNPITGCRNGCEYCYARKLANTRLRSRYLANQNVASVDIPGVYTTHPLVKEPALAEPFYPRFWEERVKQMALYTGTGKGIFTCDMSDLFGIGVPTEWTDKVLFAINLNRRNRFYLLTKQPQNLIKWSPFPENCWVGVTITEGNTCAGGYLRHIEAKVKFISFEPLLKWADYGVEKTAEALKLCDVQWVIIGSQTKPYKPPKIEWVREIVEACDKAGIPVFLKDNLKPLIDSPTNEAYSLFVNGNQELRQEMPGEKVFSHD